MANTETTTPKKDYKKIAAEIREEFSKIKTLEVYDYDDHISFCCAAYGQKIQYETAGKIMGIATVNTYKSKVARNLNKWCAAAIFKSIEKYNLSQEEAHVVV